MKHFKALDGLRGLAALGVCFSHIESLVGAASNSSGVYSQNSWIWKEYSRISVGNFCVCIFFVISGYVLISSFKEKKQNDYLVFCSLKRYFRLTPCAMVSILFVALLSKLGLYYNVEAAHIMGGHNWLSEGGEGRYFSFSSALYQSLLGIYIGKPSYNGVLWTIYIEFISSILLYFFASFYFNKKNLLIISIISIIFLVCLWGEYGVYASLFIIGMLILKGNNGGSNFLSFLWIFPALFLGSRTQWDTLSIKITNYLMFFHFNMAAPVHVFMHGIAAILMVKAIISNKYLMNFFSLKPFVWLGKISFSFYLLHVSILMSAGCWIFVEISHKGYQQFGAICAFFVTIMFSFIAASVMTRYVDRPSQKYANIIAKILNK